MTHKWLTIGLKQPRIPEFYTLTKINEKKDSGDQSFLGAVVKQIVDSLIQPVAVKQESYLKDTIDFINVIANTQIPDNVVLDLLDVSSLHTNIPQEKGIDVVCRYYEDHYEQKLPFTTSYLQDATGTKMAVTLSVISMAQLEKRLFTASPLKPFAWKRFIDNIFFSWNIPMEKVSIFVNFANSFGSTP